MTAPNLRFKEFDGDWYSNKIGEISECIVPGRNKPKKFNGDIPWVTTPDLQGNIYISDTKSDSYISEDEAKNVGSKIVPVNSVIMSCVGELGLFAINKKRIVINQQLHAFLLDNKKYDSLFILNALSKNKNYIDKVATKTALPYLNKDNCNSIPLYLSTFQEQTKIASFLSAVDEKISQLTQKHALLSQYKQGMMQKLFSQQIRFKADDGSEFGEWEEMTLKEIADFRRGSFPQPYGLPEWLDENGSPFVQVYDVAKNMLLKEKTKIKISELATKQSVYAKEGTLIITIQGSIGRIAKMQYGAYVDRTLLIFQRYKVNINIDYFKYALYLLFNIEKEKADGGVIKTITKESLAKFEVYVPCLEEQTKIANFLSAIDQKIEVVAQQLEQAKVWKKGLLQQMFV